MIIEKVIHLNWCDKDLKATPNGVDIWENNGHYYFTFDAAMREAASQGMRVPSKEEWDESLRIIGKEKLFKFLELNLGGYRNYSTGQYSSQYSNGYYWSSTPDGSNSYDAYFNSVGGTIASYNNRGYGFLVRCLKPNL